MKAKYPHQEFQGGDCGRCALTNRVILAEELCFC